MDGPFAHGDLQYKVYENAVVVPSASRTVYRGIHGAAFDADLRPIEASLLTRTWNPPQISFAPDISSVDLACLETVEEPHVYGGYFFNHFGHFLLESLARSWVVEEVGARPFVWASGGPATQWQSEILSLLNLDLPMRFPEGPIRFRQLIIPEPGFRIQGIFHPRHARFLGRFQPPGTESSAKVWLSRTGLEPKGRCPGEELLQQRLAAEGWQIVHPERLSVAEQLRLLAGSRVVAGLEGSAFHAAVLLQESASPFIVLRRGQTRNYRSIADLKGIMEFDLYGAFRTPARSDRRLHRPHRIAAMVEDLAQRIEDCRTDPAALARLRETAEAEHSLANWKRSARWRLLSHARVFLVEKDVSGRLRRKLKRAFGT